MLRQKSQKALSLKREELHSKNPVYVYKLLSFDVGSQYFTKRWFCDWPHLVSVRYWNEKHQQAILSFCAINLISKENIMLTCWTFFIWTWRGGSVRWITLYETQTGIKFTIIFQKKSFGMSIDSWPWKADQRSHHHCKALKSSLLFKEPVSLQGAHVSLKVGKTNFATYLFLVPWILHWDFKTKGYKFRMSAQNKNKEQVFMIMVISSW